MTFEQAQLYIKMFILQHYDKNLKDVIPNARSDVKISSLSCRFNGNWEVCGENGVVFWADKNEIKKYGKINLVATNILTDTSFNILDYNTLEEEHETADERIVEKDTIV